MGTPINEQTLLANGYRTYRDSLKTDPGYVISFQKRFDDETGKKYFINFDHFDFVFGNGNTVFSFSPHVQFSLGAERDHVNVAMHGRDDHTLEEVEAFFEKVWNQMGFDHYERWDYGPETSKP
jgi:hypothetical protein